MRTSSIGSSSILRCARIAFLLEMPGRAEFDRMGYGRTKRIQTSVPTPPNTRTSPAASGHRLGPLRSAGVATSEALADGLGEAERVATVVGRAVGVEDALGEALGLGDGDFDGVGECVGVGVGDGVGDGVGLADGVGDGFTSTVPVMLACLLQ